VACPGTPVGTGQSNGWIFSPCHVAVSRTFNSLFKVLFIFRSHYLFAIGLVPIFSLMGGISHSLSCSPKQPDSWNDSALLSQGSPCNGTLTLLGVPFQTTFRATLLTCRIILTPQLDSFSLHPLPIQRWALPCSLAVTSGIVVTFLSCAY